MQASSCASSTRLSALATPMRRAKSRIAAGGTPRRRRPASVGMRGSSQPRTWPSSTSWIRRRLDSTVCERLSRANSYWRGREGTGRLSISQS